MQATIQASQGGEVLGSEKGAWCGPGTSSIAMAKMGRENFGVLHALQLLFGIVNRPWAIVAE
jgi:hypothetical protein